MKKGLKITLAVLLIFGAGIGSYLYFHPKKALNVIVPEFRNIEKLNISFLKDTSLINAGIQFENKGVFKLTIDSFIYRIKLDTLTLLSRHQDLDLQLLAAQEDTIWLPLKLPFKRLMSEIKMLQKQDSVGINFDLRLVYATWLGKVSLPYKKTITIAVPIPPKLEIQNLEYKKRHKNVFYFGAHIKVINRGKLALHISDISYELVVKDNFTVRGKDPMEIHLKPESEEIVVLPVKVEFDHLFKTLLSIITDKDKVNYHLKISALAGIDSLSKEKTELHIEKKGHMELKR